MSESDLKVKSKRGRKSKKFIEEEKLRKFNESTATAMTDTASSLKDQIEVQEQVQAQTEDEERNHLPKKRGRKPKEMSRATATVRPSSMSIT